MKLQLLFVLFCGIAFNARAQEKTQGATMEMSKEAFLKSSSDGACHCIDTIQAEGVPKEDITKGIYDCIKVQVGSYMLGSKLMDKDFLGKQIKKGKTEIKMDLTLDPGSAEFKQYYYELERYLMDSCQSLKDKIKTN